MLYCLHIHRFKDNIQVTLLKRYHGGLKKKTIVPKNIKQKNHNQAQLDFWHRRCLVSYMHTNFNFSFLYPVTDLLPDSQRNSGLKYVHVIDLLINGIGTKTRLAPGDTSEAYTFEIEEIIAKNENILGLLEEANGLEAIKAACLHHVKQASFSQRADYRLSYLPLKKAI